MVLKFKRIASEGQEARQEGTILARLAKGKPPHHLRLWMKAPRPWTGSDMRSLRPADLAELDWDLLDDDSSYRAIPLARRSQARSGAVRPPPVRPRAEAQTRSTPAVVPELSEAV